MIEHPEGVIVVDTGQGAHLLASGKSLNPYVRWEVAFRIEREEEVGPQLCALGIGERDVKQVILTHLHIDHDGGLAHFPRSTILAPRGEIAIAGNWLSQVLRGYLPNRWPSWFTPVPLFTPEPFGPFAASKRLTSAGDVIAVATPGHTANHLSVVVQDGDTTIVLAGDTSYDDRLLLDGVSANEAANARHARCHQGTRAPATTVYLRRMIRARPSVANRRVYFRWRRPNIASLSSLGRARIRTGMRRRDC